ncbi:MAG: phosphoribosylformylglycinamidine synthase subunit PurQ [Bacteroidota bacterium]|jgi:phosphoribosylformylglycinamidine synthase
MKTGVVIFPGSNCDRDMIYVVGKLMGQQVVELWHKDNDLQNCDVIILPGGFSYGDYLRSGAIARFSPIMEEVIKFANAGGIIFGVCNGFQVLCESHLLPGALLKNNNNKFICENVYIKSQTSNSILTNLVDMDKALKIPIAHGEGRFYCDDKTLKDLNNSSQILFRYCNKEGDISMESNPNGSIENIAGICNSNKNVFGMMPHPERAADEELFNTDGKSLFASLYSRVLA